MEAAALALKDEGNAAFKAGTLDAACDAYTRALAALPEGDKSCAELRATLYSNRAAVRLKAKEYKQCAEDCTACLRHNGDSVKALYRRCQVRVSAQQRTTAQAAAACLCASSRLPKCNKTLGSALLSLVDRVVAHRTTITPLASALHPRIARGQTLTHPYTPHTTSHAHITLPGIRAARARVRRVHGRGPHRED